MRNIPLADVITTENEVSPIEILIGNDYCLDFSKGRKLKSYEGCTCKVLNSVNTLWQNNG